MPCAILLALALSLQAGTAAAQEMRPFTTFRQLHGETRLHASLEYAAGALRVAPGRPTELYRMDLAFDGDRFAPISDYDAARNAVALGLRRGGAAGVRVVSREQLQQSANVAFSPSAELDLAVTLGAADADLELGGLRLATLDLQTGASRSVVRFSRPNGTRCRTAELTSGAAELSVVGLGNSRCDRILVEGGVGSVTLDFSGAWTSSSAVRVRMAVGQLTLRLPRSLGVRVRMDKFLSSFDPAGMIRQGNTFTTPGYDRAERSVDLDVTAAVGGTRVEWLDGGRVSE
jgi:hypothetical protein